MLDDTGNVIGILVASAVDNKGNALEGQEFVIPASVIREKLSQVNVTPRVSDTTTIYNQALDAYYQHHYKRALPLFQKAGNLYPGHPYVADFVSQTRSAIDAGKDETPPGVGFWLLVGGGGLVVVLFVIGLFLLLRRKKKGPKAGVHGQPGPYGQPVYPPGPQQGYPGQPASPSPSGQQAHPAPEQQQYQQAYPQQQGYPQDQPAYPTEQDRPGQAFAASSDAAPAPPPEGGGSFAPAPSWPQPTVPIAEAGQPAPATEAAPPPRPEDEPPAPWRQAPPPLV